MVTFTIIHRRKAIVNDKPKDSMKYFVKCGDGRKRLKKGKKYGKIKNYETLYSIRSEREHENT